jgi:hypothetical protein
LIPTGGLESFRCGKEGRIGATKEALANTWKRCELTAERVPRSLQKNIPDPDVGYNVDE